MRWFSRWYGAGPLHLLTLIGSFALAGYAAQRLLPRDPVSIAEWFVGAVIGHDLVLFPLYAIADRSVVAVFRHRRPARRPIPWINYLRVPAALSGMLLLIWFPLIFRLANRFTLLTSLSVNPYLGHWLAVTGALFVLSALALAVRLAVGPRGQDTVEPSRYEEPGYEEPGSGLYTGNRPGPYEDSRYEQHMPGPLVGSRPDPYEDQMTGPYAGNRPGRYEQPGSDPFATPGPYEQPVSDPFGRPGRYEQPVSGPFRGTGPGRYEEPVSDSFGGAGRYEQPVSGPFRGTGPGRYEQPVSDPFGRPGRYEEGPMPGPPAGNRPGPPAEGKPRPFVDNRSGRNADNWPGRYEADRPGRYEEFGSGPHAPNGPGQYEADRPAQYRQDGSGSYEEDLYEENSPGQYQPPPPPPPPLPAREPGRGRHRPQGPPWLPAAPGLRRLALPGGGNHAPFGTSSYFSLVVPCSVVPCYRLARVTG